MIFGGEEQALFFEDVGPPPWNSGIRAREEEEDLLIGAVG